MITKRDQRIQRFIEDFKIASSRQIHDVFFSDSSLRRCQQRLNILSNQYKRLNRYRSGIGMDYLYYIDRKPPKEIEHMLIRVDTFVKLTNDFTLSDFKVEYEFEDLRADAYFEVWQNGFTTGYFLEVQLSNYFRQDKYEKAYQSGKWTDIWTDFPSVLVVTDHNFSLKPSEIRYIKVSTEAARIGL